MSIANIIQDNHPHTPAPIYQCANCHKTILYGVWVHFHYVCEECTGSIVKVKCQNCKQAFYVTQSTLDEAEGWIECDCGGMCTGRKYTKPALTRVEQCTECRGYYPHDGIIDQTGVCESCGFWLTRMYL